MAANTKTSKFLSVARYWYPVAAWMVVIFIVSSVPGGNIPSVFPLQDILFHGLCYGILAVFFYRALRYSGTGLVGFSLVAVSTVFCALYGVSDEFHQSFVHGRTASVFDVSVDTAGSFLGSLFAHFISVWLR